MVTMSKNNPENGKGPEQGFEERLKRLDSIVGKLEKGDTPLEESLVLYREGLALAASCRKQLADARLEITTLTRDQFPELVDNDATSVDEEEV